MQLKVVILLVAAIVIATALPVAKTNKVAKSAKGKAVVPKAAAGSHVDVAHSKAHAKAQPRVANPRAAQTGNHRVVPADKTRRGKSVLEAKAADDVRRADFERRQLSYAPWVIPDTVYSNEIKIILRWNTSDPGGFDLDSLVLDPFGCVCGPKALYHATCWTYPYLTIGGRTNNPMTITDYGGSAIDYINPAYDSFRNLNNSAPSWQQGVEMISIRSPASGVYQHVVYNYGDTSNGFLFVPDAEVDIWVWESGTDTDSVMWASFYVDQTSQWIASCNGRFWNTFSISFDLNPADDDSPTFTTFSSFTITEISNITLTPYVFMGTTATQAWETGGRYDDGYC